MFITEVFSGIESRGPEGLSLLHAEPGRCQSSVAQAVEPAPVRVSDAK